MSQYSGFDYEDFYEFIIDYFEADETPQAQEASARLLDWWNKYIPSSAFIFTAANAEPLQGGLPKIFGHTCNNIDRRATRIARSPPTATPGPLIPPTLVI